MRRRPVRRTWLPLAVLAVAVTAAAAAAAQSERVSPIPRERCEAIRDTLENQVPIGPGFRTKEIDFPFNDLGIEGRLCRLLAVGTGAHVEGERIRTLKDMAAYLRHALERAGFYETDQTQKFASTAQHGRHVFALYRNGAICVATIQVGMVEGAEPPAGAIDNGTIYLGELRPHEREWWVAVDCFRL